MISRISGGVTAPRGFSAACCTAGIRYQGRTDMAMLFSQAPCAVAGTFTSNRVKAAPVLWDMDIVNAGAPVQAVVVNAGIANAATGKPAWSCAIPVHWQLPMPWEFRPLPFCWVPPGSSAQICPWTGFPPESGLWRLPFPTRRKPAPWPVKRS